MSSKFLISSDSIGWTFAKPAMLVVAAVGGMSGHAVPAGKFAPPPRPATPGPAIAPGFSADLTRPAAEMVALTAATVPAAVTVPPARMAAPHRSARRPAAAAIAPMDEPAAASARFVKAFPEAPADMAGTNLPQTVVAPAADPAPSVQFAVTTWGAVIPTFQQTISPASPAAEAVPSEAIPVTALSNLRLPQPVAFAPAALPEPAAPENAMQFVSVAVVQPLPQPAAKLPELVLGAPQPEIAPAAPRTPAAPRMIAPAAKAPAIAAPRPAPPPRTPLVSKRPDTAASKFASAPAAKPFTSSPSRNKAYTVKDGVIEFALSAQVNGLTAGPVALRVTPDDRLWLRLGDLLELVRPRMAPAEFARFSEAARAADYVEFDTIRRAGIALRYDAARNSIALGTE